MIVTATAGRSAVTTDEAAVQVVSGWRVDRQSPDRRCTASRDGLILMRTEGRNSLTFWRPVPRTVGHISDAPQVVGIDSVKAIEVDGHLFRVSKRYSKAELLPGVAIQSGDPRVTYHVVSGRSGRPRDLDQLIPMLMGAKKASFHVRSELLPGGKTDFTIDLAGLREAFARCSTF